MRATFTRTVYFALTAHLTLLALSIARAERSGNALALTGAYALISIAFGTQIARAVLTPDMDPSPFSNAADAALVPLAAVITAVVGYFSFLGMMLDRNLNTQINALAERARMLESARLSEQMATLDHDRSKSLMAAALGHELNQPLTAVLTNAQVAQKTLRAGRHDAVALQAFFDKIAFNTQRASKILETTRNLVNHSTGAAVRVDLVQLVNSALETVHDALTASDIEVIKALGDQPLWVLGDEVELSQVLENVLRNAIEAMRHASVRRLHLRLERRGTRTCLQVEDSGPGLGGASPAQTVQAFYSTKEHGLGIGLSVCRTLIEKHQGSFTIENADGGGACVKIELPLTIEQHPS